MKDPNEALDAISKTIGPYGVAEMELSSNPPAGSTAYSSWDIVRLEDRTDLYRVYTYGDHLIFVGLHSDTVTNECRDTVAEVVNC